MGSHVARKSAWTVLGASALLPSAVAAAPSPPAGATSQATIGVSLSVRPRFAVANAVSESNGSRLSWKGLCIRSTSPSLRFAVTLEAILSNRYPSHPASRGSAGVPPATPGMACAGDAQYWDGRGLGKVWRGVMLLLVSPD